MNRTIILLNIIITSSFTKPIDEFGKDEVEFKKIESETFRVSNADDIVSSFVNIDDLINNSEINKLYDLQNFEYIRRLKEPEPDDALEKTNVYVNNKMRQRKGKKDETDLQDRSVTKKVETDTSTEVENIQRRKSSSKSKSASDVESTTNLNIEGRTGDYLDGPFEELSSVDNKNAPEEEFERMAFEFESPNDETNSEWDLLDDIIATRRTSNTKSVIADETSKSSEEDTSKSAKNKYEEKTVEKLNIDKDQVSKSAKSENLNSNEASKTVEKISLDDHSSESIKTKDSQVDETVKSVTKEKIKNDEITKSVNKENRLFETPKDSHGVNEDLLRQPPNFGNKMVEPPYIPRVLKTHSHPQLPFEGPRPSPPPYQFRPVNPVNQGINSRNMRLMPLAYREEQRRLENSREAIERSLESKESRNFDDFSYEKNSNAYPYTPKRNKNDYIFSKLVEASENAQRHAAGLPLNNLTPNFGGIPNLNTYNYPPIVRPFVA